MTSELFSQVPRKTSEPNTSTALARGVSVLRETSSTLPNHPGVYRMIGQDNTVLYVGKARNLKRRVGSYMAVNKLPLRLRRMVASLERVEFTLTSSETEALILEAHLIKNNQPPYNILLKDGKSMAYLIFTDHPWPMMTKHRGKIPEGAIAFGPFLTTHDIDTTLVTLQKAFLLRVCTDAFFAQRKRPCLQYHIRRCSAPCTNLIPLTDYQSAVKQAQAVLQGKSSQVHDDLIAKMNLASAAMDYEQAAKIRDRVRALAQLQTRHSIYTPHLSHGDVVAIAREANIYTVHIFFFRDGVMHAHHSFFPEVTLPEDTQEDSGEPISLGIVLQAFIMQFYTDIPAPARLILSELLPDQKAVLQALRQSSPHVTLSVPQRGPLKELVARTYSNALQAARQEAMKRQSHQTLFQTLQQWLGLPHPLRRIEIYDNSHLMGTDALGAMVVMGEKGFIKQAYRLFRLESQGSPGGDDYAMMRQVFARRFRDVRPSAFEQEDHPNLPDLILLDGGKGQLSTVQRILDEMGLGFIPLLGIAKGKDRNAGQEWFFYKDRPPHQFPPHDPLLFFLQRMRDEAHRYGLTFHRRRKQKRMRSSVLDMIPGVGPARRRALLQHFGSLEAIKRASVNNLECVNNINKKLAMTIFNFLHETSSS